MDRVELGKIRLAHFGMGGYQDAMIGFTFVLEMGGSSIGDFWGYWAQDRTASTQWTEDDRRRVLSETILRVGKLLSDAKVELISALVGVPVEVTLDGNRLKSWRILKEVL